jgi:arginyl-tRNA synthetase
VITGDLDVALTEALRAARAAGQLPAALTSSTGGSEGLSTAGTWRPAPPGASGGPGTYATTIAFLLARRAGPVTRHAPDPPEAPPPAASPQDLASMLAATLRARPEISDVTVTGGGYLTITVTPDTLAALAVRITAAGAGCACGEALRGTTLTAPRRSDLALARGWVEAHQWLASEVTGRLAAAAGAQVLWKDSAERSVRPDSPSITNGGPVPDSIRFAGADAVRYALCRIRAAGPGRLPGHAAVDARAAATQHLGNPAYAVRYAHAHAASALRQAADLGLDRGDAADAQLRLLAHPRERALLGAMSWLPERVGGAARRGRPHVLAAYLEGLAAAYFDCQEGCPAVPPGLPDEPPGSHVTRARLWLAAAARTALGAGLGLLGVAAPDRL